MQAPVAEKKPHIHEKHGDKRLDEYYWLRERENPDVVRYLEAENDYTDHKLKHLDGLREDLFKEITSRIKEDDESVPYFHNEYWYYSRFEKGKEYPIMCRKHKTMDANELILLDVNLLAEGEEYFQLGGMSISPNNQFLAYTYDNVSRRLYTLKVRDLETGKDLADEIKNVSGGAAWANDNQTFFYAEKDADTLRPFWIKRHLLNTKTDDVVVFTESDDTFYCGVGRSKSGDYIVISSGATLTTEFQILSTNTPNDKFKMFSARKRGVEYGIAHYQDGFYILTNYEAQNFRLMKCGLEATSIKNWTEVIANRPDVLLEDIELFNDHLVLEERIKGITQIRVINQSNNQEHHIDFGEEVFSAYCGTNPQYDTEWLRIGYTSLTAPNSVFDYNMNTKEMILKKEQEVVGGYDKTEYQAERLMATADDGIEVPISLVYNKSKKSKSGNPLLLYAYGSYGHSMDVYFSHSRISLMDRGFVFAIAHIRGGEDLGRQWYEDGKLLKKKNTFTDYIACGHHLVDNSYTDPSQLFAMGGSAGGLLMGVVANEAPQLWKGMIASVPFVDVVTTMLDDTIPLTTGEYDEWGNPNDKEYYDYIKSYSPYDNVRKQGYPNMLITTGFHDSQVQYWEPAKWLAKLRENNQSENTILMKTEMSFGHGGASGRFEPYKEVALEYAYLLDLVTNK